MDEEGPPEAEPDPFSVRRGSRALNRTAGLIYGFGVFAYAVIACLVLGLSAFDSEQIVFAPTVTLPLDATLGLLGLCATVLITLVAAVWANGQIADVALSRGRRRTLTAVTVATGVGSVVVGTGGALHRPEEGWNALAALAVYCLGLVLAYIAADVAFVIREDRSLGQALRRLDIADRRARLRTARRNWLRQTRSARWTRHRRPIWTRLRQTVLLLGLLGVALTAALAALGGRHAITGYLVWWFLDIAVGVLVGQLAAHFVAISFLARRWEPFNWYCMFAILYLLLSSLAQLELLASMENDLPGGPLGTVAALSFGLACCLVPLLLCLLGLTVAPRRWHRLRPMTQIRWSVIAAIGRQIELVGKGSDRTAETGQPERPSLGSRFLRAIRQANGAEEIRPGG